jgi:hypothetical protein
MGRKKKIEGKESEGESQFYWDIYDLGKEDLPQEEQHPYLYHKKKTNTKDD